MPVFPPPAPVTMLVDGRQLPTYFRAYVTDGRVFAPLEPVLLRLADRAWIEGSTLVISRDGRIVRVLLPGGDRTEGAYVEVGPLVRRLGDAVAYDGKRRILEVWTPGAIVSSPTPFDASAPTAPPRPVFTPQPVATPRPLWTGPPLPRRTPLPMDKTPPVGYRHQKLAQATLYGLPLAASGSHYGYARSLGGLRKYERRRARNGSRRFARVAR